MENKDQHVPRTYTDTDMQSSRQQEQQEQQQDQQQDQQQEQLSSVDVHQPSAVGSSVYLNPVDDFVSPSAACVNPMFLSTTTSSTTTKEEESAKKDSIQIGLVVLPQRRRLRQQRSRQQRTTTTIQQQQPPPPPPPPNHKATEVPMEKLMSVEDNIINQSKNQYSTSTNTNTNTNINTPTTPTTMNYGTSTSTANGCNDDSVTTNPKKNLTNTKILQNIVTASLSDCLACSGCITTSETVLIEEQHSLLKLKERFRDTKKYSTTPICMTISPASMADLLRYMEHEWNGTNNNNNNNTLSVSTLHERYQELVTLLYQRWRIVAVLDGNVSLQISRLAAAKEFIKTYQHRQQQQQPASSQVTTPTTTTTKSNSSIGNTLYPSVAISSTETLVYLPNGNTEKQMIDTSPTSTNTNILPTFPIVVATCPAVVCLVEKSLAQHIPQLSKIPSAMTVAAQIWQEYFRTTKSNPTTTTTTTTTTNTTPTTTTSYFHVAVMPCHDKKLEASRKDFVRMVDSKPRKDVDIVITTQELWQLLQEEPDNRKEELPWTEEKKGLLSSKMVDCGMQADTINTKETNSTVATTVYKIGVHYYNKLNGTDNESNHPVFLVPPMSTLMASSTITNTSSHDNNNKNAFYAFGSGGYANFIFAYAARELFGVHEEAQPVWIPIPTHPISSTKQTSLRTAQRQRDYYECCLCRRSDNGTYFVRGSKTDPTQNQDTNEIITCTVVLHFAMAYGMQTIQRALSDQQRSFDYIEAMACPSGGCLNGGGQLRTTRVETPTESRQRVRSTQSYFVACHNNNNNSSDLPPLQHSTRYHAVPVLQHRLGAAAGVAVTDTQW